MNFLLESEMDIGSLVGITAFFGGSLIIMILILLIPYLIISGIPMGFMFKKAGYKFWKALIPFYRLFCYHEMIGLSTGFTVGYIIALFVTGTGVLAFISGIVIFIMNIVVASRTARAFNLGALWAVGVYLCGPIIELIIGLSSNITYGYSRKTPQLVPVNNAQPMNFDPSTGQPINNVQPTNPVTGQPVNSNIITPNQNVVQPQTEQPTQPPQINSDLPDSIDSIIIKQ